MGTLARYASGASLLPLVNTDTTTANSIVGGLSHSLRNLFNNRTHTLIQGGLFIVIIALLGVHLSLQSNKTELNAVSAGAAGEAAVVDELSATELAAVVSLTTKTIDSKQVVAAVEQIESKESVAVSSEHFLSKPSVAATDDKSSQGIITHEVAKGENLEEIASQYDVNVQTIKWANGVEDVSKGDKLKIPPVNGIVYTVKNSDSPEDIASRFGADADRIIAFNDAELTGLEAGQKIIIPGGEKENTADSNTPDSSNRIYAAASQVASQTAPAFSGGSMEGIIKHYTQIPRNSYASGWCTHWAAFRAGQLGNPVGKFWGNAISWPGSASRSGFNVGGKPRVGSVGQAGNHVVVVEAVKGNMIKYSDMNGLAGWGNAAMSGWVSASSYVYINR